MTELTFSALVTGFQPLPVSIDNFTDGCRRFSNLPEVRNTVVIKKSK
jgi:hypothetical protein